MASVMIGRTACPECGFEAAHVKKSDKCTYRYCPECGAQHHAKTPRQVTDLMGKTRLIAAPAEPSPTPTPTGPEKTAPAASLEALPTPTEHSPTPTPAKRRGLFG
jgi:hypothetical protein